MNFAIFGRKTTRPFRRLKARGDKVTRSLPVKRHTNLSKEAEITRAVRAIRIVPVCRLTEMWRFAKRWTAKVTQRRFPFP